MRHQPLVIFDGRCDFCRIWIEYWKTLTGGRLAYAPSQEVGRHYPQIAPEKFGQSVQLVMPDGKVMSGARAVFMTLTYARRMQWLLAAYEHIPGFAVLSEAGYRWVARHRAFLYRMTRFIQDLTRRHDR